MVLTPLPALRSLSIPPFRDVCYLTGLICTSGPSAPPARSSSVAVLLIRWLICLLTCSSALRAPRRWLKARARSSTDRPCAESLRDDWQKRRARRWSVLRRRFAHLSRRNSDVRHTAKTRTRSYMCMQGAASRTTKFQHAYRQPVKKTH